MEKMLFRDWVVLITLPCSVMFSSFEIAGIGSLIPLIQKSFGTTDSETALLRTLSSAAHITAFIALWLFGDFMPKKRAFLLTVTLWALLTIASTLVSSEQYWLYLTLRSLASVNAEVFRILVNVLQAEHFTGKNLTAALTLNIVGESMAFLIATIVNSILVANDSSWKLGVVFGPALSLQSCSLLSIPIVYAACSALETLSYITEVVMITRSFWIFSISYFIDGIAGSGIMLNNLQLVLSTTPAGQRASALSLLRLTTSLGIMPGAQIMAAISDYYRGDSSEPIDRLNALQKTFLYTWFMPALSTAMCLVILRFYLLDVKRAKQIDLRDEEESATLMGDKSHLFDD
ncbi:hypothetical protein PRIPAC_89436 [Pristionchus pacificus]|uniref:Membrane transporter n=1 Tax=Pristionchus pacificus TaxID=54126 RepID=A0A2A6B6Y2_PRIPA|nr:hypothetical protein PRIPAC_89436 [Pristionchus pacificus]|eukprot:PDM61621.1 membrane transporter [Pristionchus pacificus]